MVRHSQSARRAVPKKAPASAPAAPSVRQSTRLAHAKQAAAAQAQSLALAAARSTVAAKKAARRSQVAAKPAKPVRRILNAARRSIAAAGHAPPVSASPSREHELTQQLAQVQSALDAQRRLHDSTIEHAVQEALRKLRATNIVHAPATTTTMQTEDGEGAAAVTTGTSASQALVPRSLPTCALPPHWPAHQSHHVQLVTMSKDSADYVMVASKLSSTGLPHAKLLQVQRVYNRPLWDRYAQMRERIMHKAGNEALNTPESMGNEQLLWHGSRSAQPHLLFSNGDGFDVRCAGHGMLGPGMYFSRTASYSGTSYAHPLSLQQQHFYGGGGARSSTGYKSPIPPLYSTSPNGKLKVERIPPNSYQMFLARVVLGTEYDARKMGQPANGYYQGRPPLRPFHCQACSQKVDLDKLNLDTLRASLAAAGEEEEEEEKEQEQEKKQKKPAATRRKGRQTRGSAAAAPVAAAAAAVAPVVAVAPPPPASPAAAAATPPVLLRRQSSRHGAASAATPAATAAASASQPLLLAVPAAAAALAAPATIVADELKPATAAAAPSDLPASESAPGDVTAAASGASTSSTSVVPSSFHEIPVACPHCSVRMGTRAELLAHPYRYDSVTSDHMSVTYESAMAYPEFIITYTV